MNTQVLRYAAFTDEGRGGNPAGVVLDAGALTDAQMLTVAAAVGYSETAFVVAGPDEAGGPVARADHATVRFFSPIAEVAFCGHATVATAVALAERRGPSSLELSTPAGPVKVTSREESGTLLATLTSPPTRTRPVDEAMLDAALAALGCSRPDLDPRYPAHVAFAGNDHLVLGVRSRQTLATLAYDYPALAALMAEQGWTTAHLFWPQTAATFQVRDPFPPGGVVEDPATGAAAAAFGGYLRDLDLVPLPSRLTLHQGVDLGRPSLLLVDVDAHTRTVQVTGGATPLAPSLDDRDVPDPTEDRSTT